jgi:hypothetical protein
MSFPHYDSKISAIRAEALFASALQRSDDPGVIQVRQAITAALGAYGDRGCVALVAQAYGDHPETAVARMRWARASVARAFGSSRPEPALGGPYAMCHTSRAA